MGYLKVNENKRPAALKFASEMWIWAILTILLFAITFGVWLFLDTEPSVGRPWWRRKARRGLTVDTPVEGHELAVV